MFIFNLTYTKPLEEAERIRDEDPFYREGAARYELIAFEPTKMSDGFRALLG